MTVRPEQSLVDEPLAEEDDLFASLPVTLQQACARGDVELDDLLERITAPDREICPLCGCREVALVVRTRIAGRSGICFVCFKRRSSEVARQLASELEAEHENMNARKALQRARVKAGARLGVSLNPRGGVST